MLRLNSGVCGRKTGKAEATRTDPPGEAALPEPGAATSELEPADERACCFDFPPGLT